MRYQKYLITLLPFLFPYHVLADKVVEQYLSEGNNCLTTGKFNDALINFDAAIRLEPENYLTYFKRATVLLSLGRNSAAVDDFSKILDLKPDFDKALFQRAKIYLRDGLFELAIQDLEKFISNSPHHIEANKLYETAKSSKEAFKQLEIVKQNGSYDDCISLATSISQASPAFVSVRSIRAQCHIAKGEIIEAVGDLSRIAQLNPSDPANLILLSKMNYYSLYEPQMALTHIKQCLHYDPEQKECKTLFKLLKKLDKEMLTVENDIELKKYATASNRLIGSANREGILRQIDADMDLLQNDLNVKEMPKKLHLKCYQMACQLYGEQKQQDEEKVDTWCSKTIELQDDDKDALFYRGQVLLNRKDYEAAVRDLEKANEVTGGGDHRIRQLLSKAQQKLKLSKKRDYYKILEVSPTADSREIKKAYRKQAQQWHPDKYSGDLDKEQVERKMADINQAYEVLSDPDKRQQYDNGFDPYDPEQGQRGPNGGFNGGPMGGFPFQFQQGGFNFESGFPFGGGSGGFPGGFKMHF